MLCSGFYLCGDSSGPGVATKTQNGEFQPTSAGSWLDVTWLVTGCHTAKGGRQRSGTNQCQMSVQRQIWHCFLYLAMKNQNRYFPPALAGQPGSPSYEEGSNKSTIIFWPKKPLHLCAISFKSGDKTRMGCSDQRQRSQAWCHTLKKADFFPRQKVWNEMAGWNEGWGIPTNSRVR